MVVLTGTDAYRFIHSHRDTTLASLEAADHIVGLHALVGNVLPERLRARLRVIVHYARPLPQRQPKNRRPSPLLLRRRRRPASEGAARRRDQLMAEHVVVLSI